MIGIINYGLGNISAFLNIYKRLNIPCQTIQTPQDLENIELSKIILPGVGAFDHAMVSLQQSGMREALDYLVLEKKIPVLGICVGMQILAESSQEGVLPGLGWIKGQVKKIDKIKLKSYEPLPHMGWNQFNKINQSSEIKILKNLDQDPYFYFLHSYYFEPVDLQHILATAHYGHDFCCMVNADNIYGIQCHPEKSHQNGINLLKNFWEL